MQFQHLSLEEREKGYALKKQGLSLREMGRQLGRHHTTISREYSRNSGEYIPWKAQDRYWQVAAAQRQRAPLKNMWVWQYVLDKLRAHWSPEQIAGRLPIDHPGEKIHHETIYRYIYNHPQARSWRLWQLLPRHRRWRKRQWWNKRWKQEREMAVLRIHQRHFEAEMRESVGHWESDTMVGRRADKGWLAVTVERKTRLTILDKLADKSAHAKANNLIDQLGIYPLRARRSVAVDNGTENLEHQKVSLRLQLPVFFCNPYQSWEKATVENTIGRVRRFLPRGTSIDALNNHFIKQVEWQMNHTPRKCLEFATPAEAMTQDLMQPPGQAGSAGGGA